MLSKPVNVVRIIKLHPATGHDILKDVTFPWPVGQIVLQHHERLDGSDYPGGLRAEGILLEAQIVAVADVVEAMASHRPYRPSLGIEAALKELKRGKGTAFNPAAVDICVALFEGGRFALEASGRSA